MQWSRVRFRRGIALFLRKRPRELNLMSVPAPKHFWRVLVISAAIVFAFASVLSKLGIDWWIDSNYSHGLLIPFIIAYILWINRQRFSREPVQPSVFWGGGAVLIALF